ncbi:MAG: hypothetical protein AAGG01_21645, partial [Planctomycetota bacterium]
MTSPNAERSEPSQTSAVLWLLAVGLLCGLLGYGVRTTSSVGFTFQGSSTMDDAAWGSYDPDTLYHARRVERAVRNHGWVQSGDPLLAHPSASTPIPWPPFYDLFLAALYRRAIPSKDALMEPESHPELAPLAQPERDSIERFVASVPTVLGALTALLAALVAAGRARRISGQLDLDAGRDPTFGGMSTASLVAAGIAGVSVALTFGHVRYSHLGNGDHHAFVSLLHIALLGLVVRGLDHERIVQPFWSATRGAIAGLIAGALITTWTASILWVALIQLALVVRLLVPFRAADGRRFSARALPIFATSFHKAALLCVVPAVIESPFSDLTPWSLVDLSWFHLVWLSVGWLIFAPYALMPRTAATS